MMMALWPPITQRFSLTFLSICDEGVKVLFSQGQQLPILLAAESCVSNGLTFMTAVGKQEFDFPGDVLIEEQSHFKVAVKLVLASSIAAMASARVTPGKSSRNSDSVRPCRTPEWIWNLVALHFSDAIQIVDLYHARQHLWESRASYTRMTKENKKPG
jgi:hypothetical protein